MVVEVLGFWDTGEGEVLLVSEEEDVGDPVLVEGEFVVVEVEGEMFGSLGREDGGGISEVDGVLVLFVEVRKLLGVEVDELDIEEEEDVGDPVSVEYELVVLEAEVELFSSLDTEEV
ncbi:hypothetical protein AC578_1352 [Pseudocercospora eumusae]|uniref:Uncharacterized protein n=1 Tax=Pseudocercospora eumusae TaxID=321146 RepID=A0A139HUL0_9PEZI|nr:hypothetical protein AC578_1352 [Pseudocercospora eumusae]